MAIMIYTLIDPRDGKIFYVGASQDIEKGIAARHAAICDKGVRRELRQLRMKANVEFIDTATDMQQARMLEEYWIWQMRSWGFALDNGRLCSGYAYQNKETD